MSSGPFTYSLSAAAAYVMRSLMEHPDLETPEAIADAPHAPDEIDAEAARGGLEELGTHGLAAGDPDSRWRLTDVGRAAQEQA